MVIGGCMFLALRLMIDQMKVMVETTVIANNIIQPPKRSQVRLELLLQ